MLLVGGMLVTGTSDLGAGPRDRPRAAGHLPRRLPRRRRRRTDGRPHPRRLARAAPDPFARPRPRPAPTDVMSAYPDDDEFEPTVPLAEEPERRARRWRSTSTRTRSFDRRARRDRSRRAARRTRPSRRPRFAETEQVAPDPAWATSAASPPRRRSTTGRRPPMPWNGAKATRGPIRATRKSIGRKLVETLGHFGVEAKIVGVVSGPHVSRYELRLAPGIKVKKVTELANDLAYALASTDIRILAPIPGKQAVGVEVPNARRRIVRLGDIYAGRPEKTSPLVAWLGKGIDGNPVWTDLAKMPHVLVAGTTGSGKSGLRQRDPLLDPDAGLAERGPPGPGRPEAGRAQPLRERAAPADPGGHLAAPRRQRPRQPDRRDGDPLRDHGRGPLPQPRRAQPRPRRRPARRRCRTSSA